MHSYRCFVFIYLSCKGIFECKFNHPDILFSMLNIIAPCLYNSMMDTPSITGTADSSGAPEFQQSFSEIRVARSLVFLYNCLYIIVCPFSFGHWIVCAMRLLITPLVSSNFFFFQSLVFWHSILLIIVLMFVLSLSVIVLFVLVWFTASDYSLWNLQIFLSFFQQNVDIKFNAHDAFLE